MRAIPQQFQIISIFFVTLKTFLRSIGAQTLRSLERKLREVGRRKKIGNILVYFIFLLRPWTDTLGKWYITFLDLLFFGLELGLPQIKSLAPSGTLPRPGSKLSLLKNEMRNICLTDNQKKSYHTQWRAYYYTKENIKNVQLVQCR